MAETKDSSEPEPIPTPDETKTTEEDSGDPEEPNYLSKRLERSTFGLR